MEDKFNDLIDFINIERSEDLRKIINHRAMDKELYEIFNNSLRSGNYYYENSKNKKLVLSSEVMDNFIIILEELANLKDVMPNMYDNYKKDILGRLEPQGDVIYDPQYMLKFKWAVINVNTDIAELNIKLGRLKEVKRDYYDFTLKNLKKISEYHKIQNLVKQVEKVSRLISFNEHKNIKDLIECANLEILNYLPVAKIGEGGTRNVYKVIHEQRGHILALKLDKKLEDITNKRAKYVLGNKPDGELAKRERLALIDLTHENLARMWGFGSYDGRDYIVEDFVEGITLEGLIKDKGVITDIGLALIFAPLFRVLEYLKEKGYVHRDIKPNNILISKDFKTVKLTDLQNAVKVNECNEYIGSSYGSLRTMAPKLILDNIASFASDNYSLGVCMYYTITGKYPFDLEIIEDLKHDKDKFNKYHTKCNLEIYKELFNSKDKEIKFIGFHDDINNISYLDLIKLYITNTRTFNYHLIEDSSIDFVKSSEDIINEFERRHKQIKNTIF